MRKEGKNEFLLDKFVVIGNDFLFAVEENMHDSENINRLYLNAQHTVVLTSKQHSQIMPAYNL